MRTLFILHGLGGSSRENWFPWLAQELRRRGETVIAPDFPDPEQPRFAAWAAHLDRFAESINAETVFVGHSLGCPFGLRYLAERGEKIGHFILTAPPFTDLGWPALEDMMSGFPPKNVRETAERFTLFASDNDPHIPLEHIRKYEELLGITATVFPNREHLWQREFPEVLAMLEGQGNTFYGMRSFTVR